MAERSSLSSGEEIPDSPAGRVGRDTNTQDLDEALIACGRGRDPESFLQIYNHFAPLVKRYFLKAGFTPERAEDLTQETMWGLWRTAANFDPRKASASTWIYTLARNKRVDAFRQSGININQKNGPAEPENIAQGIEEARGIHDIKDVMHVLPETHRDLLEKSFFEGKSHPEIARETRLPLGTVKSRLRTALSRLRQVMSHEGAGNEEA